MAQPPRTVFALICVATGVSAVVALQTISFMVQDELTTNLAELNRAISASMRRVAYRDRRAVAAERAVFTRAAVDLVREWAAREGVVSAKRARARWFRFEAIRWRRRD